MNALSTGLLLAALAVPAYAGVGSIVETEEAIIVEYTGDAAEKAPPKPAPPASQESAPPGNPAVPPPKAGAAEPATEFPPPRVRDEGRRERSRQSRPPRERESSE